MTVLYIALYVVAAVCFTIVGCSLRPRNLLALGLLAWVLVPLIHTAHR
jgi:hypothetical protein